MNVGTFLEKLKDEAACENRLAEIRSGSGQDIGAVGVRSRREALLHGLAAIRMALLPFKDWDAFRDRTEAGHGIGHLLRDFYHAVRLTCRLDADPRQLYVGLVGGTLHDIGCAFVRRYEEAGRIVRHAEAGALFVDETLNSGEAAERVPEEARRLICYAVAAHTHYLKPMAVRTADGREKAIQPYPDLGSDGSPVLNVWMTRWCDRLDCNGPAFVGRHFLTLLHDHSDFDGQNQNFYTVRFAEHLRPIIRTPEEIKADGGRRTMLEHLKMFADSQTNASPYGRHDRGEMSVLRDRYRSELERVIQAVREVPDSYRPDEFAEPLVRDWLGRVEPGELGVRTADQLIARLREIEPDWRRAWLYGLEYARYRYEEWADVARDFVDGLDIADEIYAGFPGVGNLHAVL